MLNNVVCAYVPRFVWENNGFQCLLWFIVVIILNSTLGKLQPV